MKNKIKSYLRKLIFIIILAGIGTIFSTILITSCGTKTKTRETNQPIPRPNLLYIVVDEMREMAMSCSGDINIQTPGLDHLAAEGARFTHMYSPYPVCSPTRASIHTGLFPHNAGVPHNGYHLRETVTTLSEVLFRVGYSTGHIGKWHLEGVDSPTAQEDKNSFLPHRPEWSNADYAYVPSTNHRGFQYWAGFETGHQYFGSRYWEKDHEPIYIPKGVYEPDYQTDQAIAFIEKNRDKSWYLDLNFGTPHFPLVKENVKVADLSLFDPEKIQLRPNVPIKFASEAREQLAIYYAMIHNIDQNIAKLLDKLDELNLTENTIVIFTSDHGDMMLSHGQHYKRRPMEESSRVPFIIRYPAKIQAGKIAGQYLTLVDVFPTILDLIEVKKPCNEGKSFLKVLNTNFLDEIHQSIYLGCYWFGCRDYDPGLHLKMPWRAVHTKDYMMAFLKTDGNTVKPVQLFDMNKDPYQMNNLIDSAGYKSVKEDLRREFLKWRNKTGDSEFGKIKLLN